jgi:hypothetical protein
LTRDTADSGLKLSRVEEKTGKEKPGVTRLTWRVDPATRPKIRLQPVDFCFFVFFTKTMLFYFLFLKINPDNSVETRALNRAGH